MEFRPKVYDSALWKELKVYHDLLQYYQLAFCK